ncbi:unnamed protein product, partial [Pleuronectes platessa]
WILWKLRIRTGNAGSELQTLQFSLKLNIRCERFLRAEEEFWVWIKLNLVLLQSENTLMDSLDFWTNHRKQRQHQSPSTNQSESGTVGDGTGSSAPRVTPGQSSSRFFTGRRILSGAADSRARLPGAELRPRGLQVLAHQGEHVEETLQTQLSHRPSFMQQGIQHQGRFLCRPPFSPSLKHVAEELRRRGGEEEGRRGGGEEGRRGGGEEELRFLSWQLFLLNTFSGVIPSSSPAPHWELAASLNLWMETSPRTNIENEKKEPKNVLGVGGAVRVEVVGVHEDPGERVFGCKSSAPPPLLTAVGAGWNETEVRGQGWRRWAVSTAADGGANDLQQLISPSCGTGSMTSVRLLQMFSTSGAM